MALMVCAGVRRSFIAGVVVACVVVLAACAAVPGTVEQGAGNANLYDSYMAEERHWAGLTSKRVIVRPGMEIAYSEGGDPSAPVLILLHGYYGDRNNWNPVAHQLLNRFHLIIPDLPGHGDSSNHPDANYCFAETTFILGEFIDLLQIDHFNLAGHSMGGGVAIQWSLSRGKQMDSLILVDSAGLYRHNSSQVMAQMLAGNNPMRIATPGDAARVLNIAMALPPFVPSKVMQDFETRQLARIAVYDKVMADMLHQGRTVDIVFFETTLKLYRKPALVIWGDQDSIFSVSVTDELMAALPQATLVVEKGVGHTPLLEAPGQTATAIKTFLAAALK